MLSQEESSPQKGVLGIVATKLVAIRYLIPRPRWRIVVLVASKKSPQCSFLLTTRTKGPEDHLTVPTEAGHCLSSEALPRGVFYPELASSSVSSADLK